MKLWYAMFILSFIMIYGTLSLVVLGSVVYEKVRTSRDNRRFRPLGRGKPGPSSC
jgi:hypothetical protein